MPILTTAIAVTFLCPGGVATIPNAINDAGVVVGECGPNAFIRDARGHFTLFQVAGVPTVATAINVHGAMVGYYLDPSSSNRGGFLRSPAGTITLLPHVYPQAINAAGTITGSAGNNGFLRAADGTMITLWNPNVKTILPTALNSTGEAVGATDQYVSDIADGLLVSPTGTMSVIGPASDYDNFMFGINAHGAMAGVGHTGFPPLLQAEAFIESATGQITTFPLPAGVGADSILFRSWVGGGINDRGEVAIRNQYWDGQAHTIVLPGCQYPTAEGINASGEVVGYCVVNQSPVGFLWRK